MTIWPPTEPACLLVRFAVVALLQVDAYLAGGSILNLFIASRALGTIVLLLLDMIRLSFFSVCLLWMFDSDGTSASIFAQTGPAMRKARFLILSFFHGFPAIKIRTAPAPADRRAAPGQQVHHRHLVGGAFLAAVAEFFVYTRLWSRPSSASFSPTSIWPHW